MTVSREAARISVVLPVHDGGDHISEAVGSVLAQSFGDFELLVVDDGSTDHTAAMLAGFSDPRLRIIRLPAQKGLVAALNRGIRESRFEFIARMDADDICMPRRFERQVAYMAARPEVVMCGTWTRVFGNRRGLHRLPVDPQHIRAHMFFGGAIDHPSLLMRRSFVVSSNLEYDDEFRFAEDFDFLMRAAELGQLANLPEVLLLHRLHDRQVSVTHGRDQADAHKRLLLRQLRALIPCAIEDEEFHVRLATGRVDETELARAEHWLLRLDRANRASGRFDPAAFQRETRRSWFYAHARGRAAGLRILRSYWASSLGGVRDVGLMRNLGLVARCLLRARPVPRSVVDLTGQ